MTSLVLNNWAQIISLLGSTSTENIALSTMNHVLIFYISGKVLQLNARSIPDYAVVPIDGFPVDKTVNSIITNIWLVSSCH